MVKAGIDDSPVVLPARGFRTGSAAPAATAEAFARRGWPARLPRGRAPRGRPAPGSRRYGGSRGSGKGSLNPNPGLDEWVAGMGFCLQSDSVRTSP